LHWNNPLVVSHWLTYDNLLFSLLGELHLSHELLLTLLDSLIFILDLLDRTKTQLGELEGSLGSTLTMGNIHSISPVFDVAPEVVGVGGEARVVGIGARAASLSPDMAIHVDRSDVGNRSEQREDVLNVLGAGESVVGPALDDDASEELAIGRTDTRKPLLEGVGSGKGEGLSVQMTDGFISDGLVDAKDDWLESGAIFVGLALTLGLVAAMAPSACGPLHGAAEDFTTTGLADKAEFSGRFDETCLVDHEADLKWQLHEGEGNVLDLLCLLLVLLGGLLLLLGLELSLDGVR
jgi:hypothetical protein